MRIRKLLNKSKIFALKDFGFAELLVALLPILCAYYLGPVPFSFWILLLLSIVSLIKGKHIDIIMMKPLIVFFVFYVIHETILLFFADSFNINNRIETVVSILSILFIVPLLNFNKLKAALYFISLICVIGLLYQYSIIFSGGLVHPLEVPGLHMVESRLLTETNRPSSFFMEPAAYSFYMYAPILISLLDKRYIWTGILILSVFLTSSTTGLFASFIILGVYMITNGIFKGRSIIVFLLVVVMLLALTNTDYFAVGINKFENTDFESNVRIWQGPLIVGTMKFEELLFGVPYGNVMDYVKDGRISMSLLYGDGSDVFMSTFWLVIFSFGIVGLLLYLNVFYKIAKNCKVTRPLVICLFVIMFSGAMYIGVLFTYALIVLYSICKNNVKLSDEDGVNNVNNN